MQVKRCNAESKKEKIDHLCSIVQGSFLEMPFEDSSFDGCYCIEAACHAPDLTTLYKEVRASNPYAIRYSVRMPLPPVSCTITLLFARKHLELER